MNSALLNEGPVPLTTLKFILLHLTSSFAALIISTANRGHHLTMNINMYHNEVLSQMTDNGCFCCPRSDHRHKLVSSLGELFSYCR